MHPRFREFVGFFSRIEAVRVDRSERDHLSDILVVAACAVIRTEGNFIDMEKIGMSRRKQIACHPIPEARDCLSVTGPEAPGGRGRGRRVGHGAGFGDRAVP